MESIGALSKKLSDYLDPKKVKQVNKAYNFACEAHSGQFRSSGDPYVTCLLYTSPSPRDS